MTIYQVESISSGKTNTTDCREILADILRTKGEYRILTSRRYVIENSEEYDTEDGCYLELEDPSTEMDYTDGSRTEWTRDSYVDIKSCIFCKESLVLETISILDMRDTVEFYTTGSNCYITIKGDYDITKVMLLVTMMLIYSEAYYWKTETLEEFFNTGLEEIEKINSRIEPTHYAPSRLSGLLILFYLYKNKLKYKWDVYYEGLNWFPRQLCRNYRDDWEKFRNFTTNVLDEFRLNTTGYFNSTLDEYYLIYN